MDTQYKRRDDDPAPPPQIQTPQTNSDIVVLKEQIQILTNELVSIKKQLNWAVNDIATLQRIVNRGK